MIDLASVPINPGCYLFKDKNNNIIYIGKAKNLKKRVKSYFQKKDLDPKTQSLVANINSADFIVTDSEVEALILENNLIKKHTPKYNIDLKDSKRYAYIELTSERFPRLVIARKKRLDGEYFGPFVSAAARDYIISVLTKTFKIRTCRKLPKKSCLRYHINLCDAPCIGKKTEDDYSFDIEKVRQILKGDTSKLVESIKSEMKSVSNKLNFEKALELRNQLVAIEFLNEKQNMERDKKYDEDIINYVVKDGHVYLMLFNIYKGILENKQEFDFEYHEDFFREFLVQYYSDNIVPKEIILPKKVDDSIVSFLKTKRGKNVFVVVPKIGEKKQLLDLVSKNIDITFFGDVEKLQDLKLKLKLGETPSVIECFDISHLSGTSTVASMVQFRNGKPDKNNYRRFKIKSVVGIDDFKSIAEVVRRRYSRLVAEKTQFPNLIIIDGGKGQLNAALQELKRLEIKIPIISIAKRLEEIYLPGLSFSLKLDKKSKALKLIQAIRDEAHRFAIKYNRLLRSKKLTE